MSQLFGGATSVKGFGGWLDRERGGQVQEEDISMVFSLKYRVAAMKNDADDKPRALSLEETVELLGAAPPEDTGPLRLDPIGMQILATRVAQRFSGKRGRPTDPSWDLVRKVPMKKSTWDSLGRIAEDFERQGKHVAQGQLAAIALELGLEQFERKLARIDAPGATSAADAGPSSIHFHEGLTPPYVEEP